MALCDLCGLEMLAVTSCVKSPIPIDGGKLLDPVKYGEETHRANFLQFQHEHPDWNEEQVKKAVTEFFASFGPEPERCPDCNVASGGYHHPGCDNEECPNCHLQLLSCSCLVEIQPVMTRAEWT